ncbi:hypothetical protein ONS95_014571 [Cadophora gregata]|uniref:uncharacterized protein n=1 Tax=Cadophora gregata TaxID=51156 RepID=UPI0026DBA942|nr:uncharacterized protein ONS95_014571 [Cadophora gregata]KAK0112846.1 hypothetical protein ONS95_014571 [Cadophora gregata]KAK0124975.1 hypothetical protein ONS96_008845 [Cadophora gregata f. sp. sojae]
MVVFSSLLKALAVASAVIASPIEQQLEKRAVIGHDKVVGFPQTVPSGSLGSLYLAYKPLLKVVNGCVPFPAVDSAGNTGGGLATSGASNGGCSSSTGQVYVRSGAHNGMYAVMYSWYFPKDSPSNGLGHRHDWEGVIVYLSSSTSTDASNILAVCPSAHGGWDCATSGYSLTGTSPRIKYESIFPVNHACGLTTAVGGTQPLIAWQSLPAAARTALENTNFGDANVPFKDANFEANLAKATF